MTLETASSILTIIIAVVALIYSIRAEKRSNKRLDFQIEREEKIAHANIKPFISILQSKFLDFQAVTLRNQGVGTAIITEISMVKNGKKANKKLIELYKFPKSFAWDTFRTFREGQIFLEVGGEMVLAKITSDGLIGQGFSQEEADEIIQSFQKQSEGITIRVTYEDMLGNVQDAYEKVLHD